MENLLNWGRKNQSRMENQNRKLRIENWHFKIEKRKLDNKEGGREMITENGKWKGKRNRKSDI